MRWGQIAVRTYRKWPIAPSSKKPGVTEARNEELKRYREEVARMRAEHSKSLVQPSAIQVETERKMKLAHERESEWDHKLKKLSHALKNTNSVVYRDRHPCRPVFNQKEKTKEERVKASERMSRELAVIQRDKRRSVAMLAQQLFKRTLSLNGMINEANLDARIQHAILNPVSYNVEPQKLIDRMKERHRQFKAINVPVDRSIPLVNK